MNEVKESEKSVITALIKKSTSVTSGVLQVMDE
jgi:hypothetical protein